MTERGATPSGRDRLITACADRGKRAGKLAAEPQKPCVGRRLYPLRDFFGIDVSTEMLSLDTAISARV